MWMGAKQKNNGYGRITVDGSARMIHRWVWENLRGPIPEGLTIDHLCFNRSCIETLHMRVVTRAVNAVRHRDGCQCPVHQRARLAPHGECSKGHDLTLPGAVSPAPKGRRRGECRVCARARWLRYRDRKAALPAEV